ncbi:hypothetical protein EGI32_21485 [Ferruginibacter sp. HRS2-29]|nr:hypothetical protein [Ferruginibacter sp. HRS2-29]
MCTVVFIPTTDSTFFASLRDENPLRPEASAPAIRLRNGIKTLSPADALAGGTWVCVNDLGSVFILLNGGFNNHTRQKNYTRSRGLIVHEISAARQPLIFWSQLELNDTEPFTLVVWYLDKLYQLVWDGQEKHQSRLPETECHIWSSSTLYNSGARLYRTGLFNEWAMAGHVISCESILDFFRSYTDATNGFIMNRNEVVKTLSYSFIEITGNKKALMHYLQLPDKLTMTELNFKHHAPVQHQLETVTDRDNEF